MWCVETIIALNNEGTRPEQTALPASEVYQKLGIRQIADEVPGTAENAHYHLRQETAPAARHILDISSPRTS